MATVPMLAVTNRELTIRGSFRVSTIGDIVLAVLAECRFCKLVRTWLLRDGYRSCISRVCKSSALNHSLVSSCS